MAFLINWGRKDSPFAIGEFHLKLKTIEGSGEQEYHQYSLLNQYSRINPSTYFFMYVLIWSDPEFCDEKIIGAKIPEKTI